mgnify:CR=1 FL=1
MRNVLIIAIISLIGVSCNKKTKYDNIPKLTFKNLSQNTIQAGIDTSIYINFLFEDGDGNIGFGTNNLFLRDNRDTVWIPYNIPDIPDKFNPESGLNGIIQIDFAAAFLLLRTDTLHALTDTLTWDIYMKDKAGNISNTITTTPLILTK